MTLRERVGEYRHWLVIPVMLFIMVQLAGCGDKEPEQRQAFIQFLQTSVIAGPERLPALSDDQKTQFGPYVADYQILQSYSTQFAKAVSDSLVPVLDEIGQIRVPQDYLTHRTSLQQAAGALNLLGPQIDGARKRADDARAALKQPDDLKPIYEKAYRRVVTQSSQQLGPVISSASALTQTLIQLGDFLNMQGTQVSYKTDTVQLGSPLQVTQYNELVTAIQTQHQQLMQAQSAVASAQP